jgi:alcohol dehydrogenase
LRRLALLAAARGAGAFAVRAALIHRYGDEVRIEEIPRPVPGPGDLLVQVRAASVNPIDIKIRDGKIKTLIRDRMPLVLGNDLSGTVVETGPGVSRFRVGDEIFARLDKDRIGAFAEFALVRETAAASSGGVGTFAIQLAKHLGAWVATTVGARNVELVRKLGADQAIDYRAQQFDEVLSDLDFVLDTQGGETLLRSFSVVKRGGCIVSVGALPDAKFARAWGLNPFLVLALGFLTRKETRLARKHGVRYEYLLMHASGDQLSRIAELIDGGIIQPMIDKTFPLDRVREALAYVESGRATGKVVLTP